MRTYIIFLYMNLLIYVIFYMCLFLYITFLYMLIGYSNLFLPNSLIIRGLHSRLQPIT